MRTLCKGGVCDMSKKTTTKKVYTSKNVIKYKRKLASMFINDDRIVELLNNDEVALPEDLIYKNIFPFIRVPNAPDEQLNYICFKAYMPQVYTQSMFFQKLVIEIYVISHQGELITDEGATRIDLLAEEVENLLNGSMEFGKKPLELISNIEDNVGTNHRCRILRYEAEDVDICGLTN